MLTVPSPLVKSVYKYIRIEAWQRKTRFAYHRPSTRNQLIRTVCNSGRDIPGSLEAATIAVDQTILRRCVDERTKILNDATGNTV